MKMFFFEIFAIVNIQNIVICHNRPIQTKYVVSVTNGGLGLETAMAATVNRGWQFSLTINTGNLSANYFILHGD